MSIVLINNDNQDDNADNIRFRQTEETETLLINFSQNEMNLDDICTNYKHVKLLANIHESLDWLYCKLSYYFDILDKCLNDTKHLDALTQTTVTSGYTSRSLKQNHHQYDQLKLSLLNLEIFSNAMKISLTLSYDILLVFNDRQIIVKQDDIANAFFIIEDGMAIIYEERENEVRVTVQILT